MRRARIIIAALVAAAPLPAAATTFFDEERTCPIGGEKFTAQVIGSNPTFGARPDGKPYSPLPIVPIPECPGNGLPLFDDFTADEIARLAPLIGSAEYWQLRDDETQYYRVWWLMQALGRPAADLAGTLLVASWEADGDPARKARYQQAFAEAAAALDPDTEEGFYLGIRHANALRELGRFDEVPIALDRLADSGGWPADAEGRSAARSWIEGVRQLSVERNAHPEPANMIPPMMAAGRCTDKAAQLSRAEQKACITPDVREAIAQLRP